MTVTRGTLNGTSRTRLSHAVTTKALIWSKFRRNKLAITSGIVLLAIYSVCLISEFFAPYSQADSSRYNFLPPQRIHFVDNRGRYHLRPFVYGIAREIDYNSLSIKFTENKDKKYYLQFFVKRLKSQSGPGRYQQIVRLFGVEDGGFIFLLGTDYRGRDLLTQILYGGRVTLTVGLFGVFLSTIIGIILGTVSGYFGGVIDMLIQRLIEILSSIPRLPLWMAMAAILPPKWPSTYVYWGIVTVLALIGWCGLARQIRAKVLSVRERDFVMASRAGGAGDGHIMARHIIPNVLSHIIVVTTLALPSMILAESAMSFLGLGIRPPMTSWGLLLQNAQNLFAIRSAPWVMIPGLFIMISVLCFNFLGDGLRDAADPYN